MANRYHYAACGLIAVALLVTALSALAQQPDHTIFFDDFEDGNLAGWDTSLAGDAVQVSRVGNNHVLHITGTHTDFISLAFLDNLGGANAIEARIQFRSLGTGDGSMSLNLMSENPGHASGYSALLSTGGGFLAERRDNFQPLDPLTSREFQLVLNRWYTVRFQFTRRSLNLLIDGQSVRLARVETLQSGAPVFIFDGGMEVYLDDVRIEHPDYIATATATPEPLAAAPSPTRHPLDVPNDRLLPVDVVLAVAPTAYRWEMTFVVSIQGNDGTIRREPMTFDTRIIRIRPEKLGTLIDVNGNRLQHGVYTPDNPPPLRPELLPQPLEINGTMAQYGYVVGTLAFGVADAGTQYENMFAALTFFAEGNNQQTDVVFKVDDLLSGAHIAVLGDDGVEVRTPADDRGRIPVGSDPNRNIVIHYDDRAITIPTVNGTVVIKEGDELMLAILWNQEISNFARHWGDQMPSRWSQTMFDNNPDNDAREIIAQVMGLIISDRSARAGQ
jgi:hypothetical protein